jgi:hypothetical protein
MDLKDQGGRGRELGPHRRHRELGCPPSACVGERNAVYLKEQGPPRPEARVAASRGRELGWSPPMAGSSDPRRRRRELGTTPPPPGARVCAEERQAREGGR